MKPSIALPACRGFTMIELIVILVLLGIIAVTALGRLNFSTAFGQKAVRDKAIAALQFARSQAIAQRRNVCVCIGAKAGGACAAGDQIFLTLDKQSPETGAGFCASYGNASPNEIALPLPARDTKCGGLTNAVCSTTGAVIAVAGGGPALCFDAQGRGLDGTCTAPATTSVNINDQGAAAQFTITVESETGYVH